MSDGIRLLSFTLTAVGRMEWSRASRVLPCTVAQAAHASESFPWVQVGAEIRPELFLLSHKSRIWGVSTQRELLFLSHKGTVYASGNSD